MPPQEHAPSQQEKERNQKEVLYIVTFKQGQKAGKFFTEYDMLRIISVIATDRQQAIEKAKDAAGIRNLDGIEVSIV